MKVGRNSRHVSATKVFESLMTSMPICQFYWIFRFVGLLYIFSGVTELCVKILVLFYPESCGRKNVVEPMEQTVLIH